MVPKMLWGLLSTNGSTDVASERFGAGETKLLEEGDLSLRGECCVGVAVPGEFLDSFSSCLFSYGKPTSRLDS